MRIFQPIVTGSLTVSGSVTAIDFTGSLYGTSSWAITASYAMNAGSGGGGSTDTGSLLVTASIDPTSNDTIIFTKGNGSTFNVVVNNVQSSSYALTSSLPLQGVVTASALNSTITFTRGNGSTFNVTVAQSGSVATASYATYAETASYSSNFVIQSTLALNGTLTDTAAVASTIVGSNNLFTQDTGSRTSAFCKYTIVKSNNARIGEFITVWNGTTTTYYDNSTTDIGNTADITFQSSIVTGQIQINAIAASSGWTIKMLTTYI